MCSLLCEINEGLYERLPNTLQDRSLLVSGQQLWQKMVLLYPICADAQIKPSITVVNKGRMTNISASQFFCSIFGGAFGLKAPQADEFE
jgi:ethanolamine utilization protein EutP (predicted NTPase)